MAIKVIKHGEKPKFKKTCPNCGCIFEYETEDLQLESNWTLQTSISYPRYRKRIVICPDCGEKIYHDSVVDDNYYPTYPNVIWTSTGTGTLDCDKCPNKPDPNKPLTVGDTPCTWCKKNVPYCGDVFPTNYKGGSYSVDPEWYKKFTYTNSSYVSPNFTTNYTTDTEKK